MCWVESEWLKADCTAEIFVLQKRADFGDGDLERMMHRYSALDADTPRARQARRFPDGDVPGRGERWNAQWVELREHARAVLAGGVPDPCIEATDWNGRNMPHGPQHIRVQCSEPMANLYYRVKRKARVDDDC